MSNKLVPIAIIISLGLSVIACTIPISIATPQVDANQVAVKVAQTVAAINAQNTQHQVPATLPPVPTQAPLPTYTPLATYTPLPTYTLLPTYQPLATYTPLPAYIPPYLTLTPYYYLTSTAIPCNAATAVDINYPDYTDVTNGTSFYKTWRFTNLGTCTWNTSYRLVFASGSHMGGPAYQYLTGSVAPGYTIDITLHLTAPATGGTYTGYWDLYTNKGYDIGPVWVTIDVVS